MSRSRAVARTAEKVLFWSRTHRKLIRRPWRELQVPRLPPDFLSGLVASVNSMRLSLKKAAYVALDESSVVGNPECARDDKLEARTFIRSR